MEDDKNVEEDEVKKESVPLHETISIGKSESKPRSIPPPGSGQRIYDIDPSLAGFRQHLDYRLDTPLSANFFFYDPFLHYFLLILMYDIPMILSHSLISSIMFMFDFF